MAENENKKDGWKDYEVGGIWENKGGSLYIQVDLKDGKGKIILKAFKNRFKEEGSKVPDFKVYKDLPENKPQPPKKQKSVDSDSDDDIF